MSGPIVPGNCRPVLSSPPRRRSRACDLALVALVALGWAGSHQPSSSAASAIASGDRLAGAALRSVLAGESICGRLHVPITPGWYSFCERFSPDGQIEGTGGPLDRPDLWHWRG